MQDKGILRSGDFGETWTVVRDGSDEPMVLCLFAMGNLLLAGTVNDMLRSADGGKHWVFGSKDLAAVKGFAAHAGRIYAATFQNGFYQSSDGGKTWKNADGGSDVGYLYSIREIRGALYAGSEDGVLRLSDADGKWNRFGTGMPENENIGAILPCGPNLYAVGLDGNVYCLGHERENWNRQLHNFSRRLFHTDPRQLARPSRRRTVPRYAFWLRLLPPRACPPPPELVSMDTSTGRP